MRSFRSWGFLIPANTIFVPCDTHTGGRVRDARGERRPERPDRGPPRTLKLPSSFCVTGNVTALQASPGPTRTLMYFFGFSR